MNINNNYNLFSYHDINDILDNFQVDCDLDFLKKIKPIQYIKKENNSINTKSKNITPTVYSRKRQDAINKASKKCRNKQKQLNKLMINHINNIHQLLTYNCTIDNNILNIINDYNKNVQQIKNQ